MCEQCIPLDAKRCTNCAYYAEPIASVRCTRCRESHQRSEWVLHPEEEKIRRIREGVHGQ